MPVTNIFHNLLMKRPSRFLRNAVYIVLIHERRESNCAIGFFHHKKYETGFLAYAGFTTEIRTTKVDWNEELRKLKRFDLIAFAELADFHYSRKFWDCHRTTPVPPALTGWDRFFCDVLLPLDQQRCRGKLIWRPVTWQHKHNKDIKNEDVMSRLRVIAPTGFVLLTSLPREDRQ